MNWKEVDELPVLNQADFPALPQLPEGKSLICANSTWQNAQKEFAAACIIAACCQVGHWSPVSWGKFGDQLKRHPLIDARQIVHGTLDALVALVNEGLVETITCASTNYLVPTKSFAEAALSDPRSLRAA